MEDINEPIAEAVAIPVPEAADQGLGAPTERSLEIHTELRDAIQALTTIAQCKAFYDNNAHYAECLRLLRTSQVTFMRTWNDPFVARTAWCRIWAVARRNEQDWARALDNCRKTALKLLYKVCNLATNPDGTLQQAEIADQFEIRRMSEILMLCLCMDRENCLRNMSITATGELGLGWYAEGQEAQYQSLGHPPLPLNPSGHTINKRLVKLQRAFFEENIMINQWLAVEAPNRFFV